MYIHITYVSVSVSTGVPEKVMKLKASKELGNYIQSDKVINCGNWNQGSISFLFQNKKKNYKIYSLKIIES